MMSSVMPSAKYSCSGSPLMLLNGSTAIEGLSRQREPARAAMPAAAAHGAAGDTAIDPHRIGDVLDRCSPWSSKSQPRPCRCLPRIGSDTAMPPGSASPRSRAAMLTPSPYTVPSAFSITSPR